MHDCSFTTRRRLLHAAVAAGTAGLAGCISTSGDNDTPQTRTPSSDLAPRGKRIPDQTPAEFVDTDGNTYPFETLRQYNSHPDSKSFSVDTDGDVTTLTGTGVVHRPVDFILEIPDKSGTVHKYTVRQETTDEMSGFEVKFDHSDITLKQVELQTAHVYATDTHEQIVAKRLVKRQDFIGVPYQMESGENRVYWDTSEQLTENVTCVERERGGTLGGCKRTNEERAVSHHSFHHGGQSLFVISQKFGRFSEEVKGFGAALSYPTEYFETLKQDSLDLETNNGYSPLEYTLFEDDPHMEQFAQDIADALDTIGITDPVERVEAVGRLAQGMTYEDPQHNDIGEYNPLPPMTLDFGYGDCTSKTTLTACLLSRDAFDMTPAYIFCKYRGDNHIVLGVDARDLGFKDGDAPQNLYTVTPTSEQIRDGAPDTEYVFFEVTGYRDIGTFNSTAYSSLYFYDTTDIVLNRDEVARRDS
jgi:hypothetical protein